MRILAIIPAFNEEECIKATVLELRRVCPEVDYVVINDGSRDKTSEILDENNFNHVNLPINTGLTSGFVTGMKYAARHGYDATVQFDADGQHRPGYIPDMARAMEQQDADIVIASRGAAGSGAVGARGAGAKLLTALIKGATGQTIQDPTSGMRMYNRKMIDLFTHAFDVSPEPDTISLLMRKGAKVIEIPAKMRERQGGASYLRFWSSISYMARTCISLILFQWFR